MLKELDKNYNISLAFDYKFKKVFGEVEGIRRLEALISLYFDIPYEEVKGKIEILNPEKRVDYKNQKKATKDVYLNLRLISGNIKVDIEVSSKKLSQSIIDRNILYGINSLTTQLRTKNSYKDIEKTIVICFDKGFSLVEEDDIKNIYMIRDKKGRKLTDKLQIHHVDIEKCYKIWYSKDVKQYKEDENIIKLGALLNTTNLKEFDECLGGISMDENIKKEISDVNYALNDDRDIAYWYDYEKDKEAEWNGRLADAIEEAEEDIKKRVEKEVEKEVEQRVEQKVEQEIEQKVKQEKLKNAKKMKEKNIDINTISEITNLTIEEINKL